MIGIVDCELLYNQNSIPNIACMKISYAYKSIGRLVELADLAMLNKYSTLYVCKVFSSTPTPSIIHNNVIYGGTGFTNKYIPLPKWIDGNLDYDLYKSITKSNYYIDYDIGYLTRGCIRKCSNCINKDSTKCIEGMKPSSFITKHNKVCLLDDNFASYPNLTKMINILTTFNKPIEFKTGIDFRLLSNKDAQQLFKLPTINGWNFSFDSMNEAEECKDKFYLLDDNLKKEDIHFYLFTRYDKYNKYNNDFYISDINDLLNRISLLYTKQYNLHIILHENHSNYDSVYNCISSWCSNSNYQKLYNIKEFIRKKSGFHLW